VNIFLGDKRAKAQKRKETTMLLVGGRKQSYLLNTYGVFGLRERNIKEREIFIWT
jgi:hypothetical protein